MLSSTAALSAPCLNRALLVVAVDKVQDKLFKLVEGCCDDVERDDDTTIAGDESEAVVAIVVVAVVVPTRFRFPPKVVE